MITSIRESVTTPTSQPNISSHQSSPSNSLILLIALFSIALKLLLFPAPYSTDLYVHRHWKRLTITQPISHWYTDNSAPCCPLDYPPLFAYFEYILGNILYQVPSPLFTTSTQEPATTLELTLLRTTVLFSDLILILGVYYLCTTLHPFSHHSSALAASLILLSPALTLIDVLHFQYNNLPLGLLFLSLTALYRRKGPLGAFLFSLALNAKHTFLPLTPPIAIHLLLLLPSPISRPSATLKSLLHTAIATILPFAILWFPFYFHHGQTGILIILRRLFPFSRGLLHANWAANAWALYAAMDIVLSFITGNPVHTTRGHIAIENPFSVLPNPTPVVCAVLILVTSVPTIIMQLRMREQLASKIALLISISSFASVSFVFGWHVHEKAVLQAVLPLLLTATCDPSLKEAALWLSVAGQFALLELVRDPRQGIFALTHFAAFHVFLFGIFIAGVTGVKRWRRTAVIIYALGCIPVELYAGIGKGHWLLLGYRLPFLPLLIVSLYSAVGVVIATLLVQVRVIGMIRNGRKIRAD